MLRNETSPVVTLDLGDGTSVLYDPDTMAVALADRVATARAAEAPGSLLLDSDLPWLGGALVRRDADGGLLRSCWHEPAPPAIGMEPRSSASGGPDTGPPLELVLFLTGECNCSCRYCYLETSAPGSDAAMSASAVDDLLGLARAAPVEFRRLWITFHGGEPLTRFDLLRQIVRRADALRDRFDGIAYKLYTNGTLITPETARFLADHEFVVEVSADGGPGRHDRHRRDRDGGATFEPMAEGARRLLEHPHVDVSAAAVVTRFDLDLVTVVTDLERIGFPRVVLRYAGGAPYEPRFEDLPALARAEAALTDHLVRARRGAGHSPTVSPHMDALSALARGEPELRVCSAGRTKFLVHTDGYVYPCLESARYPQWRLRMTAEAVVPAGDSRYVRAVTELPACASCWARYLCGGPCPARSVMDGLEPGQPSRIPCLIAKIRAAETLRLFARMALDGDAATLNSRPPVAP